VEVLQLGPRFCAIAQGYAEGSAKLLVWVRMGERLGAEGYEMGIGFDRGIPFFSDEKLCGFGSDLLQLIIFFCCHFQLWLFGLSTPTLSPLFQMELRVSKFSPM